MLPQGVTDSISPTYINGRNAGFLESEQRAAQLAGIEEQRNTTETRQSSISAPSSALMRLIGASVCNVGHVLSFELKVNTHTLLVGMSNGSTVLEIWQ